LKKANICTFRLTLAGSKNKNKTENLILFLSRQVETALAVEQKQKIDNDIKHFGSSNQITPYV